MDRIGVDRHKVNKCYFCDRVIISKDIILDTNSINEMKKTLGNIPEKEAGKIGNRYMCRCCLNDLKSLIE